MVQISNKLICVSLMSYLLLSQTKAKVKRCYSCRSRGPLGDCRDPFEYNATTVELSAVEAQPCASGWCGKSLEGEQDGQHLVATERMCLQRPPSDNKERCADTFYGKKKKSFFMCFCKGDLCNSTTLLSPNTTLLFIYPFLYLINIYSSKLLR